MQEKSEQIKQQFILALANLVKEHREKLNKTVYMISAEASVPRSTWRDLEFCVSKDINLFNFCKIAEGLEIPPHKLLKELTDKLGNNFSFTDMNL